METVNDVRKLLKRFGTYIYSKNRLGDLILMESELEDLHQFKFITNREYLQAKLIVQRERRRLKQNESEDTSNK